MPALERRENEEGLKKKKITKTEKESAKSTAPREAKRWALRSQLPGVEKDRYSGSLSERSHPRVKKRKKGARLSRRGKTRRCQLNTIGDAKADHAAPAV